MIIVCKTNVTDKVANKIGEVDKAWKYLEKAHALEIERREKWDEDSIRLQADQVKSIFVPSFWPVRTNANHTTKLFYFFSQ